MALAVDIGGTKLAVGLVDSTGRVLRSERAATPTAADPEVVWTALAGLVDRVRTPEIVGVGVGCGGPMRWPSGEVSPLNIRGWREFPLRDRLAAHCGVPTRVHNDAIAVAIAEHWRGAGQGHRNVLGMVVSTGVGGGLVLGGRVVDGASGNAGHVGHVVVDPSGPECECGGRGCVEAIASGPRTLAWATARGWVPRAGGARDGAADGASLARDALAGQPIAVAALARAGAALGTAIASAVAVCDVEIVCVGGGLSQAGEPLWGPLREAYRAHAGLFFARSVQVVPAALGQDAGLVGAAALVLASDAYWSAD
ncbi:MAG: ROK family protein [Sporichthyaceae bacterium]